MKKQVVVIGLGRFGISVANTLYTMGHDVLAVDKDESKVQRLAAQVTHAVQADATDEKVLTDLGVRNFDVAIVAIGADIRSSVLSTLLLKDLGVPYLTARANDRMHGSILERIGADRVIYLEREMGAEVAREALLTDVTDYMPVAERYGVATLTASEHLVGHALADIGLGHKAKLEVAALLIRRGKEVVLTPSSAEIIRTGDILVLSGSDENLERFLAEIRQGNVG